MLGRRHACGTHRRPDRSATFTVQITRTTAATGTWSFGVLIWSDPIGRRIRSPIALRSAG
jgi:hypothetical protein